MWSMESCVLRRNIERFGHLSTRTDTPVGWYTETQARLMNLKQAKQANLLYEKSSERGSYILSRTPSDRSETGTFLTKSIAKTTLEKERK